MNNRSKWLLMTVASGLILTSGVTLGDSGWGWFGEREHDERDEHRWERGVQPVTNDRYKQECGDCHMAYPPGLLPSRSWEAIMTTLDDHFAENAELDGETVAELTDYLTRNSSDGADERRAKAFDRSSYGQTPLRISETRYFLKEHDEIPQRLVKDNPKVKSFSNCNKCHADAEQGYFDEDRIDIPGYGRWDD